MKTEELEDIAKAGAAELVLNLSGQDLSISPIEKSDYAKIYDAVEKSGKVEYRGKL